VGKGTEAVGGDRLGTPHGGEGGGGLAAWGVKWPAPAQAQWIPASGGGTAWSVQK
jgi:hypothetical protein